MFRSYGGIWRGSHRFFGRASPAQKIEKDGHRLYDAKPLATRGQGPIVAASEQTIPRRMGPLSLWRNGLASYEQKVHPLAIRCSGSRTNLIPKVCWSLLNQSDYPQTAARTSTRTFHNLFRNRKKTEKSLWKPKRRSSQTRFQLQLRNGERSLHEVLLKAAKRP